uniref:TIR domain-containing protein n=1 Tax=Hucho hucho TaxID=62062 RepID=A0A4W5QFY8_9TELE
MKQLTTLIIQFQNNLLDIKSLSGILCRIVNNTSSLTSLDLWAEIATLSSSKFTSLCKTQPSPILWLKIISLHFNSIFSIHHRQLFCMINLEELDLKYNRISTIDNFYLNLEANPLVHIEALSFAHLSSIQNVSLGDLNFPPESKIELNLTCVFGSIPQGLTYLYISSGRRPMTLIIGVDLNRQAGLAIMFHNLTRLETLMLLGCRIDYLEKDLSKDLQSLRELRLANNNELTIMEEFPEPLKSLKDLLIQDLLLQCSCNNAWFYNWAKWNRQVQVMFWHSTLGMKEINCIGEHGTQNFLKYSQIHCSMDVGFILFVSNTQGLLLFMLVVLLHHLAGQYLLALFYITRGWLEEDVFRNNKRRCRYEAFVSYSGKDERWVVEELLPNMEQRGPPFLRLCLHSRDFELGKDIVDNITDSLYSSRRTVCLVSRHYLRSNWCSLEMKLATDRLRVEQRDILILVFLEDISPHQLSTRTYLDWPKEPEQYQDFWDRLWATLAPKHGQ